MAPASFRRCKEQRPVQSPGHVRAGAFTQFKGFAVVKLLASLIMGAFALVTAFGLLLASLPADLLAKLQAALDLF